jgi:3',5'-cyclic AMP phosphodiesterase CpdA
MRKPILALAALLLLQAPARADSFTGIFEADYSSDAKTTQSNPFPSRPIKQLVYPVLGFPTLVAPGDKIEMKLLVGDGGGTTDWKARIETSASPTPESYALQVTGVQSYDQTTGVYTVEVALPSNVPSSVYDLEVTSASFTLTSGGPDRQPNCVRVLLPGRTNPSFVILADSQLQDVTNVETPQRLAEFLSEVRLRDPDFCLFVGDLNFGSDYASEYETNLKILTASGLAIFCVPGNHDGYATTIAQSSGPNPPGLLERDGLNHWRRYIGPTLYSFDWLDQHFVAVNSMGGDAQRRNSVGILVTNYGGEVDPDHLDWIEQDLKDAQARGKKSILFMHHDPTGTLTANTQAYPFPLPTFSWQVWNDQASQDRIAQLLGTYDVSHVFYGHVHQDAYAEHTFGTRTVPVVATTTIDCGSQNVYGYRFVQTQNGLVSEIHYLGLNQQSVPYPAVGLNVTATFGGPEDGSAATLDASVTSRLLVPSSVLLALPVQAAPGGLRATGGAVLESVTTAENGAYVARVRGTVPASGQVTFGVEPVPSGGGVSPVGSSGVGAVGSAAAGATVGPASFQGSGGGGGGGCALETGEASSGALAPCVLLLLLAFLRRRSS